MFATKMKRFIPSLILVIAIFFVWYFYPCFTFKGTYTYTFNTEPEPTVVYIIIDDKFRTDSVFVDYKLYPLRRKLKLTVQSPAPGWNVGTIKLGWNKFYEWDFKGGYWVERRKVKVNQPSDSS